MTDEEFKDKLISDMLQTLLELSEPISDSPYSWYQERERDFRGVAERNVSWAKSAHQRFTRRIDRRNKGNQG